MTWLLAILALGFLVLIHETGHFLVARLCRMKVETFSIGFGPALLSLQGKETEYRVSLLPLGGYVRVAGMAPGDGTDETAPNSFMNKPAWQRFLVLAAGPFVNWFFAFVMLTALFTVGMQVATRDPIVGQVVDGTPAAAAGLMADDRIVSIDGKPIDSWMTMTQEIKAHAGKPMSLVVNRNGSDLTIKATPSEAGRLGIAAATVIERYPFGESMSLAAGKTFEVLKNIVVSLGELFKGSGEAQLMGPVGIVSTTAEAARMNVMALFAIMVQISLALAFMNLLPLPALDGGRILFILIAAVRRRPVDAKVEAVVHGVGMLVLLGLLLFATWGDIGRQISRARSSAEVPPAPTEQPAPKPAAP